MYGRKCRPAVRGLTQPNGGNADNSIQESGGTCAETPTARVALLSQRLDDPERRVGVQSSRTRELIRRTFAAPGVTSTALFVGGPEQFAQRDRILKTQYWHLAGGLSYSTEPADLFVSIEKHIWGRDTHDGIAYTVGSTWYFDFSRPRPLSGRPKIAASARTNSRGPTAVATLMQ